MRSDRERLADILEAIYQIEKYASRGRDAFERDELVQNWVASHLQIIGEACASLSENLRGKHPEIPWRDIIGQRQVLVHHYFRVDLKILWSVVQDNLPTLKAQIGAMLAEASEDTASGSREGTT